MIPYLFFAHFLVTPAGEVILKLFLRADLDVAEVVSKRESRKQIG